MGTCKHDKRIPHEQRGSCVGWKKLEKQHCANCHEEIERTDRAACGWQHVKTQVVCCAPRDATPMTPTQEIILAHQSEPSPLLKMFRRS